MLSARSRLFILGGLIAAYAAILGWYHSPYAGGADSSGYMNSARLLLAGRLTAPLPRPAGLPADEIRPHHFLPLGFRLDASGENLVPSYPVGLPLHFAAIGWFTGIDLATTIVGVGAALVFAGLLYALGRDLGLRPGWSLGVSLLTAVSPLTICYALQPMSDLIAAAWSAATVLCALRSSRHPGWAVAAGSALAVAVLVRPTSALLILPVALALHPTPRTWLALLLGGLPGVVLLAGYNHALYGEIFDSGYADVESLFSLRHAPATLAHYARWLPIVATPLVIAALALPWVKIERRFKAVLSAWAGSILTFYAVYAYTQDAWWYLRFILPALPSLGLAAGLVLQQGRYPVWLLTSRLLPSVPAPAGEGVTLRLPLTVLLFAAAAGWMIHWGRELRVTQTELDERTYRVTADWVNEKLPRSAMLVAYQVSGCLVYYTGRPILCPNHLTREDYDRLNLWLEREKRPLYAALFPLEEEFLQQRLPGRWERVAQLRQVAIWRRIAGPDSKP